MKFDINSVLEKLAKIKPEDVFDFENEEAANFPEYSEQAFFGVTGVLESNEATQWVLPNGHTYIIANSAKYQGEYQLTEFDLVGNPLSDMRGEKVSDDFIDRIISNGATLQEVM